MDFVAKIADSHRERIREIAGTLEKMGVEVRQVQPILGLIMGSSEVLTLEQVKVEGIIAVEPDRKWGMPAKGADPVKDARETTDPVKDARETEERRAVVKRSGGKAKRKD